MQAGTVWGAGKGAIGHEGEGGGASRYEEEGEGGPRGMRIYSLWIAMPLVAVEHWLMGAAGLIFA